ncbi:MAG TPA: GPW/gp25 family protein [Gemmatimonadaceae bacterium]|jgi:phage baseplate assembly protein W|nr:GPW/gp25 family protein [Gemmatimonadaceae bacterium]
MMATAPDGSRAFLGIGWSYPMRAEPRGDVAMSVYDADVREAVLIILGTSKGERVMRPDFGAGLNALLFEPVSTTTAALARQRVEEALVLWEPRIDSVQVDVSTEDAALGRLRIEIAYRVRATNTFYNLVYPFYLSEAK